MHEELSSVGLCKTSDFFDAISVSEEMLNSLGLQVYCNYVA